LCALIHTNCGCEVTMFVEASANGQEMHDLGMEGLGTFSLWPMSCLEGARVVVRRISESVSWDRRLSGEALSRFCFYRALTSTMG
jgi:hypothetical protein